MRRVSPLKAALRARFAASAEALQKGATDSYTTFRTAYVAQQQKMREALAASEQTTTQAGGSAKQRKAYAHPFHDSQHSPVTLNILDLHRDLYAFLGPEIVSPHYESFFHSRKWGLSFMAGFGALQLIANSKDLPHFAASVLPSYMFWSLTFYFFLEAKSSLIKPLLFQFQSQICEHEKFMVLSYWNDSMREFLQKRVGQAREQLDYYNVHEDYYSIKAESINRFLAIEQVNLRHHIQGRALRLLQTAEQMETANQRYLINNIIADALAEVDRTLNASLDAIQDAMFESALLGIKSKRMAYENDPLLPLIRQRIQEKISKLTNLTEAEKQKLVQLSEDQLETLRVLDRQIRDEFLKKAPKLDQSLRAYPAVKKALDNWGKSA